jgi:hypothetical protein
LFEGAPELVRDSLTHHHRSGVLLLGAFCLGFALQAQVPPEIKPTCGERLAAEQADLSTLQASQILGWGVGMRLALLERLDQEIGELAGGTPAENRLSRAGRLLDLYLLLVSNDEVTKANYPGLEQLGIRRLKATSWIQASDLNQPEEPHESLSPVTPSLYYLQVENELAFRLITKWMTAGALTDRFAGWKIYKIRFNFPIIKGFGGPHLVDWVPCFHGEYENRIPGILTKFRSAGLTWAHTLVPKSKTRHAALEESSTAVLLEPYNELVFRKMDRLGWKEAIEILSKLDPKFAVTLIKMAGYEPSPYRTDELSWVNVNTPNRSTQIAVRVLAALKVMHSLHFTLVPAGTMPPDALSLLPKEIGEGKTPDPSEMTALMQRALKFSGPISREQWDGYYSETDPAFYFVIEQLNQKTLFVEDDAQRILKKHALQNEDRSYWAGAGWTEYDLLRTLDFVVNQGLTFHEQSNEWVRP